MSGRAGTTSVTEKIVTTVTEYFWRFTFSYELIAFQGTADDRPVSLLARSGGLELKTAAKTTPRPQTVIKPAVDVELSWLLARVDAEGRASFAIDRTHASCHTPRRNREIDAALVAFEAIYAWCAGVAQYFAGELLPVQHEHGLDLSAINDDGIFAPAVPLFESGPGDGTPSPDGLLPVAYASTFLAEQQRSLDAKFAELDKIFPRNDSVITVVEARLVVLVVHAARVCQQLADGVAYVEQMLRQQLIAAIGKEVTPTEFTSYMDFHGRKLLKPGYRPRPFSHAVRRPDHAPEGVLSLEAPTGSAMADPISTAVAWSEAARQPLPQDPDATVSGSR